MKVISQVAVSLMFFRAFMPSALAQDTSSVKGPREHVYSVHDGLHLKAFVFHPVRPVDARSAIVIFHGGGWSMGEPAWAFGRARHFAGKGMVAIAVQYRLSDGKKTTLLEAIEDAKGAIQWTRANSKLLNIDPQRIAAYGWSAGGHLSLCTAIFADTIDQRKVSSIPNAIVLVSPAVELEKDMWAKRLLGGRVDISSISPVSHVRSGLPPTLILQGNDDTVTPVGGVRLFHDRMSRKGNKCVLKIFPKVGHLFTPVGIRDDQWPQPDPKVQAEAYKMADKFLASLGFVE